MNKDVIYIDVDDDVTAIIGKLKNAKEKIVALVPPKRAGALQSAVNLRLLQRMATTEGKKLVLITNNQALIALAASAKIPIARNLQSKPELPDVPALVVDDGDDIIDGANLPVGDHAGSSVPVHDGTRGQMRSDIIDSIDVDRDSAAAPLAMAAAGKKPKGKTKIPNFDTFRKKLIVGISAGVLLAALLVWMFVFAPAATVIISARTADAPVSTSLTLSATQATDLAQGRVKAIVKQEAKNETIEFAATGQKDLGQPARGSVRLTNSVYDNEGATIPAGTTLRTTSGTAFTTDRAATFTAAARSVEVDITAAQKGTAANGVSGSLRGTPAGVNATIVGSTSGGTEKIVKVPTAADIERAHGDLIGKSTDQVKKSLSDQFTDGDKVIGDSFTVERGAQSSAPAADQEAPDGKATLTIATTYTMYAIPQSDLETYLKQVLEKQLLNDAQKVYDTGSKKADIGSFRKEGESITATLTATGQVGPKIDESAIKEQVKGKRFGEVQSTIQSIEGVQEVDVKFSYPWVWSVPGNTSKIDIEFKLQNES